MVAREKFAPWVLVAVVLAVLIPGSGLLPLIDRDEPRFASATREMAERGDWIVPTFNGRERFDKPVLTYWLMRAGYALAGEGELGARLHAIAATIGLVLLTWFAGRRWFGWRAGFAAGLGLATCLQIFIHGRLALADMPMVLAVAVAQVALGELLLGEEKHHGLEEFSATHTIRRRWWWTLYIALGLGFLAKGPVALAVPALTLVLFRFVFWRRPILWRKLHAGWGLSLVLLIVAGWGGPR